MKRVETQEVGTIWTAGAGDDLTAVDLGREVVLGTAHRNRRGCYLGRAWYLQGDRGMLMFEELGDEAFELCKQFLRDAGYRLVGDDCYAK